MTTPDTLSARPTPEAILGVLGKLRRTLSLNVAEQNRAPDKSGLIKATDVSTGSAPNLLRPSPGLDSLSRKSGLPSDRSQSMAELESAAPPVELERPSKPPTEEAAFTIASSGSAPPDSAPPGSAPSETAPVESDLSAPAPSGAALPDPGRAGPQQSTELPPAQVRVPLPSRGTPPAVSSANAEAQPPSATTPPHASSQPMPDTSASSSSVDISASAGAAAEQRRQSLGVTTEARGSEALAYGSTAVAVRLSGDSPTRESPANTVSPLAGIVSPQTKHVSPRADGDLPGRENGAQAPELEKGLDAIIEELALEVSHLQPVGVAKQAQQAQQGSYLQRHTSSVVLKIAQEASVPPLPAVATMAQPKAETPAQPMSPRPAGKPAEAQQAKHALKSMAASLKRAYDEGRLRERSPAPNAPFGAASQQESSDASAATLRTYRPSSKSMKDYNPPPAQHNPSPNLAACPSSYAVLKASMRRSISPRAAAHALPLNKRPAWDASPPPRRSPQRAQHGLPESNLNAEPVAQPLPQRSDVGAQRAQHGLEEIGHLKVSSQRPKPLSSAESAALAVAALLDAGQSASPNRWMTPSIRQTQPGPRVRQQPMQSPATSQPHPSAGTIDEFSALPSDVASSVPELVGDDASGGNNPTKLSRNPSSSQPATGLLQPAWVSPSQRRRTSSSQQPSPLRPTTGSRTLTPPKATADRPAATADRPAATAHHRTPNPPRAAHATLPGTTQGLAARQGLGLAQAHSAAQQTDAAQLDARGRSPSLAANLQADAHSLAHAQALQRLQQAVQEYKSSSANVLVPAAVQLAAALRRASRATEEPVQSVEALRLAGLKLRHEAGVNGADEHVPKSPWPDWVRGAWGSPHGPRGEADKVSSHGNKRGALESAQQAQRAKAAAPVDSDNIRTQDKQQRSQFELAQQAEQAGSNHEASLQNRNSLLKPHAEQHTAAATWSPVKTPGPQPTRRSILVQRALSEAAAAAAAAREAPKPRARTTATPPRRAVTKQQPALPLQLPHKRPVQGQSDQALHAVPTNPDKRAGGRSASHTQDANKKAASKGLKVTGKSKVKAGQQSAEAVQSTAPVQVQTPTVAAAVHAVLDPAAAVESEAAVHTASQVAASDAHTSNHFVSASDEHTKTQTEKASVPTHSSTSVAALRKTFEQKAGHVDSIKPRNRLPLRKVSSKAHVLPGDNASPQQRALAWQQSLRDEHDPEDSQHPQAHALHAAGSQTDLNPAEQQKHSMHEEVTTSTGNATVLMHTMSGLVARQGDVSTAAASRYAEADQSDWQSTAQQAAQFNLTEAAVAAANAARSSAEKLPISHRLTVTRSTFDSDQGSLVSMDSDTDEADSHANTGVKSPVDVSHPLVEEATLALLPDRGVSPASEATEEGLVAEGRAVSWRGLRWAHGPSWVRVVCRLTPSPTPHFIHPQGPHLLQANLGRHGADAKQFSFDQVLTEDSSPSEVAAEAEGLVEAVLQGHNSVVMALGQSGSGKTYTMAGDIAPLDRTRTRTTGLSQAVVESLFFQIEQGPQPGQVHSVHMTAFQIQDERIQDLMQAQPASSDARQLQRKGSKAEKHEVFVDKEKRTWVSNLAAIQIMSPTDFSDVAELIASRRYSSSSAHSLSHGQSSCIITLLVTVDLPCAPVSHGPLPRPARGLKPNSPSASAATSTSAVAHDSLRPRGSPTGQGDLQRGVSAHNAIGTCRSCIKLSFVEVGCAAAGVKQPARRVSAEPLQQTQLSKTSTSLSSFRSMSSTSSSKWAVAGSGAGPRQAGVGGGRGQDGSMRAVAEVVWATAHGKGVPVPHRQCKLTRYLQDTLHPAGRAVAIVCIDPSAGEPAQTAGMATLSAAERMVLP